jgi:hypothetical protein
MNRKQSLKQLPVVVSVLFAFAVAANAYTVVLKGGKRIQIPEKFVVTPTVVSYEVAPGMNVTMQLVAVDIAETEKANHEASGSFMSRIQAATSTRNAGASGVIPKAAGLRTITNRDLENYRLNRIKNEASYEANRSQTGFPALSELRERAERESVAAQQFVEKQFVELQQRAAQERAAAQEREANRQQQLMEFDRQMATDYQWSPWGGEYFWPTGSTLWDNSFHNNWHSRFGLGFGFGFNNRFNNHFFPHRRIFVAPGTNTGRGRGGGAHPGGSHTGRR